MIIENKYLISAVHIDETTRTVYTVQGYCSYACHMLIGFTENVWVPIQKKSTSNINVIEDLIRDRYYTLHNNIISLTTAHRIAYEIRYQLVVAQKNITQKHFWAIFNEAFVEGIKNENTI